MPKTAAQPHRLDVPAGIEVNRHADHLDLLWRWPARRAVTPFLTTLGLALATLATWMMQTPEQTQRFPQPWWLALVLLTALAAYWTLARLVNHTTIAISQTLLTVQHRPLPWPGRHYIESSLIRRLMIVHRGGRVVS